MLERKKLLLNDILKIDEGVDQIKEITTQMELVHELFLLLKFSNFATQLPSEIFKLIVANTLMVSLSNNSIKDLFTYPILDTNYDQLAEKNIKYLNFMLKDEDFWSQHSIISGLPKNLPEIKNILADKTLSLNLQMYKIKQIAKLSLKETWCFGLFAQPMKEFVSNFFKAIINNSLDEFLIKFESANRLQDNHFLKNAQMWG